MYSGHLEYRIAFSAHNLISSIMSVLWIAGVEFIEEDQCHQVRAVIRPRCQARCLFSCRIAEYEKDGTIESGCDVFTIDTHILSSRSTFGERASALTGERFSNPHVEGSIKDNEHARVISEPQTGCNNTSSFPLDVSILDLSVPYFNSQSSITVDPAH